VRKRAKKEAQNTIKSLNPKNISGWGDLIEKLEEALKSAKKRGKHYS